MNLFLVAAVFCSNNNVLPILPITLFNSISNNDIILTNYSENKLIPNINKITKWNNINLENSKKYNESFSDDYNLSQECMLNSKNTSSSYYDSSRDSLNYSNKGLSQSHQHL